MIIETKGTKTGDAAPTGAQTYAPKVAAKSSPTPYYLALAVAAVAGYLKSLFHTSVQAEVEPSAAGHETKAAPKLIVIAASDVDSDEPPAEHRLLGSSGIVPQAETPAPEYEATHFPAHTLHFARHDPQPNLSDFKSSPIIPRPINDNADRGPGVRGGGGGGRDKGDVDEGTGSDNADDPATRPPGGLGGGEDLPGGGKDLPGGKDKPPAEDRPPGQDTAGPGKSTGIDGDRGVGPGDPSGGG